MNIRTATRWLRRLAPSTRGAVAVAAAVAAVTGTVIGVGGVALPHSGGVDIAARTVAATSASGTVLATEPLTVRAYPPGTGQPSTQLPATGTTLTSPATVSIACYYIGQSIAGPAAIGGPTDYYWDQLTGPAAPRLSGGAVPVVADAWIHTDQPINTLVPACTTQPPVQKPVPLTPPSKTTPTWLTTTISTTNAQPQRSDNSGTETACVFNAQQASGLGLGHVAWAVRDPRTDGWIFGSADGGGSVSSLGSGSLGSASGYGSTQAAVALDGSAASTGLGLSVSASGASSVSSGLSVGTQSTPSAGPITPGVPDYQRTKESPRVWLARTDSLHTVVHDFSTFGWYSSYRCKNVTGASADNAYTTAMNDMGFNIVTNNCLNHARNILLAYKPGIIAEINFRLDPNSWYANLGSEGFGAPNPM